MSQPMERTYFCNEIMLSLLLVLLFSVTDFPSLAMAESTDVHILNLVYETDGLSEVDAVAYNRGFNASLWNRSCVLAKRKVDMKLIKTDLDKVASSIEKEVGNSDDLYVVLGPGTTEIVEAVLPALENKHVVAFGPLGKDLKMRKWNEHLYYFLPSISIFAYTFLRHAVINMRARRIGVMYMTNVLFGDGEYKYLNSLMKSMDGILRGVFSIDGSVKYTPDNKAFNGAWETFAKARPQVVIVFGLDNSATKLFIQKVLQDPRTTSTDLMLAHEESMIVDLWKKSMSAGESNFNGRMFTISSVPDSFGSSSAMVSKFRPIIDKYLQEKEGKSLDEVKGESGGSEDGSATLAGWIAGEILFKALSRFNPALNRTEFISSLYNQRTYIIEEFVVGTFAGNISNDVEKSGAIRFCNEGSTAAYMKQYIDPQNSISLPEGDHVFSMRICHHKHLKLVNSAAIVTVNFTDVNDVKDYMISEITKGQEAGALFLSSEPRHDMTLRVLQSTYDNVTNTLQLEKKSKWVNIVIGLMHETTLDIPRITFIDPKLTVARTNKFKRNVVFLAPTAEQQLFVLAEYVASLPDRTVHAIIRGAAAHEVHDMIRKSFLTFGVELTSYVLMSKFGEIEDKLGTRGITLLFGAEEAEIPMFVAHLQRNTNARLVVLFDPFALFYKGFCAAFNGTEAAERLLIITNLPHWADENSQSDIIQHYHESIGESAARSPLSLQSFIVGRFIRDVVDNLKVVDSSSVADYFYSAIAVHLDDMTFGPFADSNSVTCTSTSDPNSLDCAQNFGASSISIWPMSRVFDPNVGILFGPVTPSLKYLVPSTGLTRAQQIGIIVGTLVGAAVLAGVLGLLFYFFCKGGFNAPKDPEGPVTLIFTDIQSSTAMWAACPDIMPDAVETHHRLIRRLIARYKCYEVKTVGDSFMIACKSPYAAVQLVEDLQRTFLQHDWGTSAFDKAYHEFEDRQAEDDADYKPPTARLDDAVYREYWSGLRVRAGVHTGLSDIRYDEVTGRYDYYGSTSNTAARTESVANGGQVLLTRAAYMALSSAERAGLNVTALGAVELRGVPEPVEMFQLNPVPGRTFAKLRLERANYEFDFDESRFTGIETSGSLSESLSLAAENVFAVLQDTFASFPPQQRLKALEPLCKRWNVTVPVPKNAKYLLAIIRVAEERLAIKITRVIERRQSTHGSTTDGSELLFSTRGSFVMQNHPKRSSSKGNLILNPVASEHSQGIEKHGGRHHVSFSLNRGSLLSATSSIHVKRPSFLGAE